MAGNGAEKVPSAELYDPATGTFSATGSMTAPRFFHTLTFCQTRECSSPETMAGIYRQRTSELYDPSSGTFSPTGSMTTSRMFSTATLLPNGRVLIAGSADDSWVALASAEIYDPASGTFSPTGGLSLARYNATATLLADGRVLVAGGDANGVAVANAELFDPVPVVSAGTDQVVTVNNVAVATFSLSGSAVGDFGPFTYRWSQGGAVVGTTATIALSRTVGVHTFDLLVTDSRGSGFSDSVVVTAQLPASAAGPQGPAGPAGAAGPRGRPDRWARPALLVRMAQRARPGRKALRA